MILDELVLENFSAYGGRQEITLTPKGKKRRLIIVGALNGRGKTTMLDAIQLALYGNRARISNRGSLAYETYLSRTRHRGASVTEPFSVELEFSIHEGQGQVRYRVRRAWIEGSRGIKEVLEVRRNGERDRALTETWAEHIEELLPLEISSLFFFDGEKVESLANPDQASGVISAAVTGLLGLGVIERLQRDLMVIERRKQTEAIGEEADVDLGRFEDKVAEAEGYTSAAAQRCAEAQNVVDRLETELKSAEDRARKDGGDLFERRLDLERGRATAQDEVTVTNTLLREVASGALPLGLCTDLLGSLEGSAAGASALEAPELRSLLVGRDREVLDRLRSELSDDVAAVVEAALAEDVTRRVTDLMSKGYQPSLTATRAAAAAKEQINVARQAMADLLVARTGSLELVADFERQQAGIPAEEAIAATLERRAQLREEVAEARGRLGLLIEEQDRAERDLALRRADLEKERQAAAMQRMQGSDAVRVVEHAAKVRDTLEQLKSQVRQRSISRIEEVVVDCFRKLLGKENFITKLELDPTTCEPTLTNKVGQQLHLERLSAGERQLFAVSMLWGLAIVSGRQLPTIIDTPLGRLDSMHRFTLVDRYFPKAAEQVILLSTDKEIDFELAERLAPVTGRWYRVDYDNDRESSTISNGYFFEGVDDVA